MGAKGGKVQEDALVGKGWLGSGVHAFDWTTARLGWIGGRRVRRLSMGGAAASDERVGCVGVCVSQAEKERQRRELLATPRDKDRER